MLEPLRCNSGDGIILVSLASRDASKLHGITIAHAANQFGIDILLQVNGFFYFQILAIIRYHTEHGAIADTQELCLVVSGDGGVSVGVSRKEGKLFGQTRCVHFFLIQRYSFYYIKFLFLKFYLSMF